MAIEPPPNLPKRTGAERTAILLMSLGEESAAEILRHMGPKEVQKVGTAMATLRRELAGWLRDVMACYAGMECIRRVLAQRPPFLYRRT